MSSIPATPFCGAGLRPCDRDYPKKDVIRGKPHAAGGDRCEGDWNPPDGTGNSQWIEKKDAESALYWLLAMTDSVIVGCGQAVVRCYQHRQRPPSHPATAPSICGRCRSKASRERDACEVMVSAAAERLASLEARRLGAGPKTEVAQDGRFAISAASVAIRIFAFRRTACTNRTKLLLTFEWLR